MYLEKDINCIYDDTVTCIDGVCTECSIHLHRVLQKKAVQLSELAEQITIEEVLANGKNSTDKKD